MITGGAGFLGSHLTSKLLESGYRVTAIDDFSSGVRENIYPFLSNKNYKFIEHDVREYQDFRIDFSNILNFACPASPQQYQIDPVRTIETNFLGVTNMLKLAKSQQIQLLQASTSEIYGDPELSPQNEEYWGNVNPIGIRSCYDEGKRAAETLCFDYRRQYGVDTRVIRIFNTYGPRMAINDGRVVSNFIVQAIRNESITIYGDGSQTRSFCYVSDLVDGIYKVMISNKQISTPLNLGNPEEFSIKNLAEKIIELTGSKSKIIYHNLPFDDPKQRKPDITRVKAIIDWDPKVTLEMGLNKSINYFRNELASD